MTFLNNKYTKWYYQIIETAKNRINEGYIENHHIIPACLGGIETVALSAREHFICHYLLTKMTIGETKKQMYWAFQAMQMDSYGHRYNSKLYDYTKKEIAKLQSERKKGKAIFPKGTKFSDEHRSNMSKAFQSSKKHKEACLNNLTSIKNGGAHMKLPEYRKNASIRQMGNKNACKKRRLP